MIFSDEQIKNNLKGVSGTKQNGIDFSIMDFGLIEGEIISINANNNSCKFKIFEHDKILNGFLVFPLDTNRFTLRNGQYYPNYKCGIYIIQGNDIDNYFIIPKDIYQNGNIDDKTIKDILKKINENLNNKIIEINNTINNIKGNKIISVDTIPSSGIFKEGDLAFIKSTGDIYQYQNNNWVFQANIKGSGSVTQQDILDAIAETNIDAKTLNGKEDTEFATSTQGIKAENAVPKSTTVNGKQLNSNITINKIDVGLENVDNTSDADKPISTVTQNALNNKLNVSQKGSNNGLAELDINGKVPSTQLPSYVDDVLEYSSLSNFPTTGETGKIYLAIDTNKIYRWSGTTYIIISETITLGETNSTAYRGDRGKIAYDHSQLTSGNPHNVTKVNVGLGNVDNTSDINKPVSTATTTALNAKVDKTIKINNKPLSSDVTLLVSDITSAVDLTTAQILQNKTIKNSILDEEIYAQNSQFIIEREKEGIPEPNGWHEPKPFLYTTENTGLGSDVILKYLKDPIDNQDAVNKQYLINKLNNIELQSNSISDLNNAIQTGFYNCYSAENAPSDGFYTIEVNTDGANVIQRATNANRETYQRVGYDVQNNPSWSEWTQPEGSGETGESILNKLKTVDGTGSGLDADLFNGFDINKFIKGNNELGNTVVDNIYDIDRTGFYYVKPSTNSPSWLSKTAWHSVIAFSDENSVSMFIIQESNDATTYIALKNRSSGIFTRYKTDFMIETYDNGFRIKKNGTYIYSACWGSASATVGTTNVEITLNFPFTFGVNPVVMVGSGAIAGSSSVVHNYAGVYISGSQGKITANASTSSTKWYRWHAFGAG